MGQGALLSVVDNAWNVTNDPPRRCSCGPEDCRGRSQWARRFLAGARRFGAPCAWLVAVIPLLRPFPFDFSVVALVVPLLVDSRRASTGRVAARSFPGRTAGDPVQWPVGHVDAQVAIGRSWPVGTAGPGGSVPPWRGVATPGSGGVQGVVSIPVISRGAPADVRGSPKSFGRISVGIGYGIHHAGAVLRPVPQIPRLPLATAAFVPNATHRPHDAGRLQPSALRHLWSCSNTGKPRNSVS